jgi:histidyl-tRNA synthetase
MKSQMKKADASGAEFAVIIGESEAQAGTASVKALRSGTAERAFAQQSSVPVAQLADALIDALQTAESPLQ